MVRLTSFVITLLPLMLKLDEPIENDVQKINMLYTVQYFPYAIMISETDHGNPPVTFFVCLLVGFCLLVVVVLQCIDFIM